MSDNTFDDYLEQCPFLLENTFADSIEMERQMCKQQFWRRDSVSNNSLGILNQYLNSHPNSYQLYLQRAKWIPWVSL